MKKFLDKLTNIICRPKFEKLFMVVLPCTAVLIAMLMLVPQLGAFYGQMRQSYESTLITLPAAEEAAQSPVPKAVSLSPAPDLSPSPSPSAPLSPSPAPSPGPVATPAPTPAPKAVSISASSTEKDLYVRILDEGGAPVEQEGIIIMLESADGSQTEYASGSGGTVYLTELEPGDYTVSIQGSPEYKTDNPVSCTVKEHVEYEPIENITEIVFVEDVSVMYTEELTYTDIPPSLVPETIVTPEEAKGENNVIIEEIPVLDESGNQTYTYEFVTGENGYLLLSSTGEESRVIPVDENGDGKPEYGLYEKSAGLYVSELLYKPDGSPLEKYKTEKKPMTETVETPVGWQNIDGKEYYYGTDGKPVTGLNEIDGRLYYFSQFGVKAERVGIDVSYFNEDIDWQQVKANGIDFAILRAGGRSWESGSLYYDTRFKEYLSGAKAAGLDVGVYFYSTAINEVEAVQEASVTLELIGGVGLELPVFIDMEYSGMYPDARMDKLTIPQRSAIANAFCKTIINSGYESGVYSGEYYYELEMDYNAIADYTIWLASYTKDNKLPDYKYPYDIWQFTDSARVRGIQGGVDMNVIF